MHVEKIIAEAELSIGFIQGTGLGAILLTLIAVVFLIRNKLSTEGAAKLLSAVRPRRRNERSTESEDQPTP